MPKTGLKPNPLINKIQQSEYKRYFGDIVAVQHFIENKRHNFSPEQAKCRQICQLRN